MSPVASKSSKMFHQILLAAHFQHKIISFGIVPEVQIVSYTLLQATQLTENAFDDLHIPSFTLGLASPLSVTSWVWF